jgi:hypothetical protein
MPDYEAFLRKEEKDRDKFEQFMTKGEKRVTKQMLLIEELRADGHDTTQAEELLEKLTQSLEEWHQTRIDATLVKQTYELLGRTQTSTTR